MRTKKKVVTLLSPVLESDTDVRGDCWSRGRLFVCKSGLKQIGLDVPACFRFRLRLSTRKTSGAKRVYIWDMGDENYYDFVWSPIKNKTKSNGMYGSPSDFIWFNKFPITNKPRAFYVSIVPERKKNNE